MSNHNPITPKEEYTLKQLPKDLLVKIAIELDPDMVAEAYKEGWTKEDIVVLIKKHLSGSIGRRDIEGGRFVKEVQLGEPKELGEGQGYYDKDLEW
jgi:hypothetical protein